MAAQRKTWTIAGIFVGTGIVAWASAMAVDRMVKGWLALPDGAKLSEVHVAPAGSSDNQKSAASRAPPPHSVFSRNKVFLLDSILTRNIFDSSQAGTAAASADVGDSDRKSDLKAVLLATVVADPPEYSSALITEEGSRDGASGYGVGDELMGEATIVRVEQRRVIIRRTDGTIEYISMEADDARGHTARKRSSGDDGGVSRDGENHFTVDKDLIDNLMANPAQLYSQIRVTPHHGPGGEIDGYRLSGIRRHSFFSKLGLKNGDVVHSVNGKPLTSVSEAMDAYNSLQDERHFTFEITRRNHNETFEYDIR